MRVEQSISEYVDALTNLCMQGHAAYARSSADTELTADPLRGHLGRAAVAAATRDLATLKTEVAAAEAIAPRDPAVLQTQAVMQVLLGDAAAAVVAARAAVEVDASPRSRSGLARVLLL